MSILTENWHTWYIGGVDSKLRFQTPDLDFWIFDPKIHFWAKLDPKIQSCPGLSEKWYIRNIRNADSESRLRFLIFRPQNSFLGKFGSKNSKLSVLSENWYTQYLEDADSESKLRFWKFWPEKPFWANLGQKSQLCPFYFKNGTLGIFRMWILISRLFFWILKHKFI